MSRRILITVGILVSTLTAASPSLAVASDATLKTQIKRNLVAIRPALSGFQEATDAFKPGKSPARLEKATRRLTLKISTYKRRIVAVKTSTATGAKGKKLLLSGLGEFGSGLRQYKRALDKLDAGASKTATRSALRKADRRFMVAAKFEDEALATLNVERPN